MNNYYIAIDLPEGYQDTFEKTLKDSLILFTMQMKTPGKHYDEFVYNIILSKDNIAEQTNKLLAIFDEYEQYLIRFIGGPAHE